MEGESPGDTNKPPQAKLLQLRKARFRGSAMPGANVTPAAHSHKRSLSGTTVSICLDENFSSGKPAHAATRRRASGDLGILQEISNSSLRRNRRSVGNGEFIPSKIERPKSLEPSQESALFNCIEPSLSLELDLAPKHHERRVSRSKKPAVVTPVSKSPSLRSRRSTGSRKSLSDDINSGYIEHLEHQISLLEAQIQSLTSPGRARTQSMKLRALSSEARLLHQELADWEIKFDERLRQSSEQQDTLVGNLRAQIRAMKKASAATDAELDGLRADNQYKDQQLEAAELLNHDLEKRLEMMSDLLASSPTRLNFSDDAWSYTDRRNPKPLLRRPPISPTLQRHTSSLCSTPQSPTLVAQSPATSLAELQETTGVMPAEVSAMSTGSEYISPSYAPDQFISPHPHRWSSQLPQASSDVKSRPSRRMRRFHSSSAGPRVLILPATAYSVSSASSAPTSAYHTPDASADHSGTKPGPEISLLELSNHVETADVLPSEASDELQIQSEPVEDFTNQFSSSPTCCSSTESTPRGVAYNEGDDDNEKDARPLEHESILPNHNTSLFDEIADLERQSDTSESSSNPKTPSQDPVSLNGDQESVRSMVAHEPSNSSPHQRLGETIQSPLMSRPLPLPLRILNGLASATSRALAIRTPRVKRMLTNAWSIIALSRPVLEFRWWLVKLLIGDFHRRGQLLQPFEVGLDPMPPPDPDEVSNSRDVPAQYDLSLSSRNMRKRKGAPIDSSPSIWELYKTRERYKHATPPPVSWLKFSITLVFAVGIAIKDGPASLFIMKDAPDEAQCEHSRMHRHQE